MYLLFCSELLININHLFLLAAKTSVTVCDIFDNNNNNNTWYLYSAAICMQHHTALVPLIATCWTRKLASRGANSM